MLYTRRAFLGDLVTGATSGILIMAGVELAEDAVKKSNQNRNPAPKEELQRKEEENLAIVPKEYTDKVRLPIIKVSHAAGFTLGGGLGVAAKKIIEAKIKLKQKDKELDRVNKELLATISELQKLEKTDLPGIERILKEFIRKEGIIYEADNDVSLVTSIRGLSGAILIYVDAHKKAVQPFLEEWQKLRDAIAGPFIEQLKRGVAIDATETNRRVVTSDKIIAIIVDAVAVALKNDHVNAILGKNLAYSIAEQDLLSGDGIIALKESVAKILRGDPFTEALTDTACTAINEYDIVDKLANAIGNQFEVILQDNASSLVDLKDKLNLALEDSGVPKELAEKFVNRLQKALSKKS